MYDFKAVTDYAAFRFWFTRLNEFEFNVFVVDTAEFVGVMNCRNYTLRDVDESKKLGDLKDIKEQFHLYRSTRPEYFLGLPWEAVSADPKVAYETLLAGCFYARANRVIHNADAGSKQATAALTWLEAGDFYQAPASSKYHDAHEGGLLTHTLRVYNNAMELRNKMSMFTNVYLDSTALIALAHDWCKIGLYESYMRNVKDDTTGQWTQRREYRRVDEIAPLGHGASSMYLLASFARLELWEATAIRWHMGEYNVAHNEMDALHCANAAYPMCYLIQFADRLACVPYAQNVETSATEPCMYS
jgi:hypothetical protein